MDEQCICNSEAEVDESLWKILDQNYNIIHAHHSVNIEKTCNFLSLLSRRCQKVFKKYIDNLESAIALEYLKLKVRNQDMLVHVNPININDEKYFLLHLLDITNNERLKINYEHNKLMLLSRSIAHDVNNILTVIINTCDSLFLKLAQGDASFTEIA